MIHLFNLRKPKNFLKSLQVVSTRYIIKIRRTLKHFPNPSGNVLGKTKLAVINMRKIRRKKLKLMRKSSL